jgi:hypothetical protein
MTIRTSLTAIISALALCAAGAATASAASLSISVSPTTTRAGTEVVLTHQGTTEQTSSVTTVVQVNGRTCAPTSDEQDARPNSFDVAGNDNVLGDFAFDTNFVPEVAARYRFCSYLVYETGEIVAGDTTVLRSTEPPSARFELAGPLVQNPFRTGGLLRIVGTPAANDVTFTATGRSRVAGIGTFTLVPSRRFVRTDRPGTLRPRLTAANLRAARRALRRGRRVYAVVLVTARTRFGQVAREHRTIRLVR